MSCLTLMLAAGQCVGEVRAQPIGIPREHHVWGKFGIGSWKQVRIQSEALDSTGQVVNTSIIESKTTLTSADDEFYTLTVESSVEVGGKKISVPAQVSRRNYQDIPADQSVNTKSLGTSHVTVESRKHACRVIQSLTSDALRSTVTNTYYADTLVPYVLYREVVVTNLPDESKERTTQQVTALAMPHKVQDELRSCAHIKQLYVHDKGRTQTLVIQCLDVPGGAVQYTAKELDAQGTLLRRSTLELVDYRVVPFVRSGAWGEIPAAPWTPLATVPLRTHRFWHRSNSLRHRLQMRRGAFATPNFTQPPIFTGPSEFSSATGVPGPSQFMGAPRAGRFTVPDYSGSYWTEGYPFDFNR